MQGVIPRPAPKPCAKHDLGQLGEKGPHTKLRGGACYWTIAAHFTCTDLKSGKPCAQRSCQDCPGSEVSVLKRANIYMESPVKKEPQNLLDRVY